MCTRIVSTGSEGIKQWEIITIRGKQGQGLMKTDVGLWSNHGSSGQGWMPGCPSAPVGDLWGLISIWVVGVVCGQDEMTLEDTDGCNNDWSLFRVHQGWLRGRLGGHGYDAKFDSAGK